MLQAYYVQSMMWTYKAEKHAILDFKVVRNTREQ